MFGEPFCKSWVSLLCSCWGLWGSCGVCGDVWPPNGGLGSPKEASDQNCGYPEVDFDSKNKCELDVATKCLEKSARRLLNSDGVAWETHVTSRPVQAKAAAIFRESGGIYFELVVVVVVAFDR